MVAVEGADAQGQPAWPQQNQSQRAPHRKPQRSVTVRGVPNGGNMSLDTNGKSQQRPSLGIRIVAISVIAVLCIALGVWFAGVGVAGSPTAGTERQELVHLDNQRVIVDNSMNLYEPLVNKFFSRYTNAFAEEAPDRDKQQVFDEETGRLQREARINHDRLQRMESSPALRKQEVADAFNVFQQAYGAVVTYNEQRVIDQAAIARSIGGACASIHSKFNVNTDKYAEEYVKAADGCLAALSAGKEGSGQETSKLLSDVETVISTQRGTAQKVIDSRSSFERSGNRILSGLALLDINKLLNEAQTKYESDVKAKYSGIIEKANTSNAEFERILKESLASADQETKSGE
jgi:hypothetical protein